MTNTLILVKSIWAGITFLSSIGGWRWVVETKQEESFSWPEVFGVVFLSDYRREMHFQNDPYGDY